MIGLTWNCRGLNNTLAPTIPKLRALFSSKVYDFCFLIETKCTSSSVFPLFRPFGFMRYVGVDAVGSSGGLWVEWRREAKLRHVFSCTNFIILLVEKYVGRLWYLVLFYGDPCTQKRSVVLEDLECCLASIKHPYLIMGDFNQVEFVNDKLSKNSRPIEGAHEFNLWRVRNELIDIPYKGPRFTWCNNRKGADRVYERIDRALGSKDWLFLFPNTGLRHYPIQISDHAPIELDLNLTCNNCKKPYKIDAWALEHEECIIGIKKIWLRRMEGSPAYQLSRKLARVRNHVKCWALDRRQEWRQQWDSFDVELEKGMEVAITDGDEVPYTEVNERVKEFSKAAGVFWRQIAKLKWMVDGDTCTRYFFNWVKGRACRNIILGIKDSDGAWIYEPDRVSRTFHDTFVALFSDRTNG
ncbi:uncharacterized protein LOC141614351 [Silene latifolia]|uniref:uncharacterized protein LOC141614351 n=1 Tax=Silene latifolia TaxID=37657 RepID=UPI003D77FEB4